MGFVFCFALNCYPLKYVSKTPCDKVRVLGLFSPDQKPSALDHLGRTPDHQGEIASLAPQMSCCPSNPSSPFLIWGHTPASSLMARGWSKRLEFAKSTNFPQDQIQA